jgi:hypothetical protein
MYRCEWCDKAWETIPADAQLIQQGHGMQHDLFIIDRIAHSIHKTDAPTDSPYVEVRTKIARPSGSQLLTEAKGEII